MTRSRIWLNNAAQNETQNVIIISKDVMWAKENAATIDKAIQKTSGKSPVTASKRFSFNAVTRSLNSPWL